MQPHESISMMAESEESNRTEILISMRQPPQNTARLPKAEQRITQNIQRKQLLANSSNQARGPGVTIQNTNKQRVHGNFHILSGEGKY